MKKLNKVNVKRNDTVVAFACGYYCNTIRKLKFMCDKKGSHVVGYTYSTNSANKYYYHK